MNFRKHVAWLCLFLFCFVLFYQERLEISVLLWGKKLIRKDKLRTLKRRDNAERSDEV